MPPQIVENLLWFYTDPGDIVVDPFAGSGTTIDTAKAMGRRVWASDRQPSTPTLPIHEHDIMTGWPGYRWIDHANSDAETTVEPPDWHTEIINDNEQRWSRFGVPRKAKLILLDPPYWQQAKGKYSDSPADLANMSLDDFYACWSAIVKTCVPHIDAGGHLAYIISPTQCDDGSVIDHATDMLRACWECGLKVRRRRIVMYQTQQATGQQVTWARENKRELKLYRDLVVLSL
jgi:hypothetical protein